MRRYVYDCRPEVQEFVRLRDNGNGITLAYKYHDTSCKVGSTIEIEVVVSDFDKTAEILSKFGFLKTRYQENKRQIFKLKDIEFSIDSWPRIPPYLGVESKDEKGVAEGLKLLGLEGKDSGDMDVQGIFLHYGIDLNSFDQFKF